MDQSLVTILVVTFFFTSELLTRTAQCAISSSMNKMANTPYYNLLTRLPHTRDGKCEQHLLVVGRGLSDSFTLSCANFGKTIINAEKYLIYENPGRSFSLFSDSPSVLVVIVNGQCTRKAYVANKKKKITTSTTTMSETECQQVAEKIKQIKRDNLKGKEELQKESEEKKKLEESNSKPEDPVTPVDNGVALETPESQIPQDKKDSEEEVLDWNF